MTGRRRACAECSLLLAIVGAAARHQVVSSGQLVQQHGLHLLLWWFCGLGFSVCSSLCANLCSLLCPSAAVLSFEVLLMQ